MALKNAVRGYLDGTTVGSADIDAGAVNTAALGAASVTTAKIANLAVTNPLLAASAVTGSKVAPACLRNTKNDLRYTYREFRNSPVACVQNTGAAVAGASGEVDVLNFGDGQGVMESRIIVGQAILLPVLTAVGLNICQDGVATHGAEFTQGILASSRAAFVAGTDAAFFCRMKLKAQTVQNATQLMFGFRKIGAYQAAIASYTDFAAIGLPASAATPSPIKIKTNLASGGVVTTDTTNTWADGATHTLEVDVSAAGVVTYLLDGVAPAVVAAYTFGANTVVPFLAYINNGAASTFELITWECGFQADA